jgi:glycosyltransferase involved in cell wall biosynthesis
MTFKIAINGAVLNAQRHGISRYTKQLLRHLSKIDTGEIEFCVFADEKQGFADIERLIDTSRTHSRVIWDTIRFYQRSEAIGADAIHSPDKGPFLKGNLPLVSTIHDLLPYLYSDERDFPNGTYWQLSLRRQVALSDAIITVSESTKQDVIERFGVSSNKVHVTPLGTDLSRPSKQEVREVQNEYGISATSFNVLYVGNYNDRKNVDRVVEACKEISKHIEEINLFLAGGDPSVETLQKKAGCFRGSITFLGYVPDEHLEGLYGAADLFVYPSSYEGFGLPVLEAMACGTPVITSDTSSLPEVTGDAAITIDPESTSELSTAIRSVYDDKELRESMKIDGLKRAEQMTWERTAQETLSVYKRLVTNRETTDMHTGEFKK